MKWIKSKTKHDHWKYDDKDILPLEKWSVSDLDYAIEMVEKSAKRREEEIKKIPDGSAYFLRNSILFRYERDSGQSLTTNEIRAKLPEPWMTRLADWIKLWRHDQMRREVLFIAKMRKVFGNEYYKMEQVKKERETLKDYEAVNALKDKEPNLSDNEIYKRVADEKGKNWKTVKSNCDYTLHNKYMHR